MEHKGFIFSYDRGARLVIRLISCSLFFIAFDADAQTWGYPWMSIDTSGDTVWHSFPPADSTYVGNEIAIKFQQGSLDYSQLCYDCNTIDTGGLTGDSGAYFPECKETLLAQHFDLTLINDTNVRHILAAHGVTYLARMTAANPCTDTLSLARDSTDTIPMDDFNWIIVYFNNDTCVPGVLEALYTLDTSGDTNSIEFAELDHILALQGHVPNDPLWSDGSIVQYSLVDIGMPTPIGSTGGWDYDVGDANISVAVIDNGLDYWRCDLGAGIGPAFKVRDGWDYEGYIDPCTSIYHRPSQKGLFHNWGIGYSGHGTAMAGIIGALTNNYGCSVYAGSGDAVAGIGGGWGTIDGGINQGLGVRLIGYNCTTFYQFPGTVPNGNLDGVSTASAIMEASALSIYGLYGEGVVVINNSYGEGEPDIGIRAGITSARNNFVDFVAAKGDGGGNSPFFPSDYDPQQVVIGVAASEHLPESLHPGSHYRSVYSQWNNHVDIIAPGGNPAAPPHQPADNYAYSILYDGSDCLSGPSGAPDYGTLADGTSGAAAHVSGVDGLLRGYCLNSLHTPHPIYICREDPENILKATSGDVNNINTPGGDEYLMGHPLYATGYDVYTGWGFLHADSMFQRLNSYSIAHFEVGGEDITYGSWQPLGKTITVAFSTGPTQCTGYIRQITGYDSYSEVDPYPSGPVYVWGNDNIPTQRGWPLPDASNFVWQDPWCEVTDGSYGNGYVEGLRHETSTTVNLDTYQYDLYTIHGAHLGHFPPDRTIPPYSAKGVGLGFTVFYGPSGMGPKRADGSASVQTTPLNVWPTFASNVVNVSVDPDETIGQFIITDALGRIVCQPQISGTGVFTVSTSDLPSGLYVCRLLSGNDINSSKFVVCH